MRNIKLTIKYDGTDYKGWQVQKIKSKKAKVKRRTIQEAIEKALKRIIREEVSLIGSGRTDAGVHALGQAANFKTNSEKPLELIQRGVNAVLPDDIVIKDLSEVDLNFHSRFDVKSKIYRYSLLNRSYRSVFERRYTHLVGYNLDIGLMKKEISCLIGRHNFKAFQAADKKKKASIKSIKSIKIQKKKDSMFIDFEADGFLYMMIRNIVGTLIEIGRGKFKKGSMKKILKAKDRRLAGPTVPACGLCLLKVNY